MDKFSKQAPLIKLKELESWIIFQDEHLLVINKPGWVVCHPSKNGPFSSLVGACREYTRLDRLHVVGRLDRETSGLVILAKTKKYASICQSAVEFRRVKKSYVAILHGEMPNSILVDAPLAKDLNSPVFVKQTVREDETAKSAKTYFEPIFTKNNYTLAKIDLFTGRKHQIRAHAQHIGYPIVGDKIYGPDDNLYLEFIENGWADNHAKRLPLKRQALHSISVSFEDERFTKKFTAPLTDDLKNFCIQNLDLTNSELEKIQLQFLYSNTLPIKEI